MGREREPTLDRTHWWSCSLVTFSKPVITSRMEPCRSTSKCSETIVSSLVSTAQSVGGECGEVGHCVAKLVCQVW